MNTYRMVVMTAPTSRGEWIAQAQIASHGTAIGEGEGRAADEITATVEAVRGAIVHLTTRGEDPPWHAS